MEGALKLKEISYIHAEAYAAGEMKHGPIALITEQVPVVVVATEGHTYEKVVSNIQEVRARGAEVVAVATDGDTEIDRERRLRALRAADEPKRSRRFRRRCRCSCSPTTSRRRAAATSISRATSPSRSRWSSS